MILFALYILATLDGAFCGNRSAAGRSGLIDKRRYYFWAMLRGALWAQAASLIALVALMIALSVYRDPQGLLADLNRAAWRMIWVFGPYTILILTTFMVRALPSVDVRSATSVLIFGPMTALRPLVSIGGVLYGIVPAVLWETRLLGLFVLMLMFAVQEMIDRRQEHRRVQEYVAAHPPS